MSLPSGGLWLHEIKHDGFRIVARKTGARVKLYSRPGNDLTERFPLIVETLANLRTRSCIIDGEAVCCDDDGRPRCRSLVPKPCRVGALTDGPPFSVHRSTSRGDICADAGSELG